LTRADDEALLRALDLFTQGRSMIQIARATGMTVYQARGRVVSVIEHDRKHDPEAHKYWKTYPC
jgi:hypothetical protein